MIHFSIELPTHSPTFSYLHPNLSPAPIFLPLAHFTYLRTPLFSFSQLLAKPFLPSTSVPISTYSFHLQHNSISKKPLRLAKHLLHLAKHLSNFVRYLSNFNTQLTDFDLVRCPSELVRHLSDFAKYLLDLAKHFSDFIKHISNFA